MDNCQELRDKGRRVGRGYGLVGLVLAPAPVINHSCCSFTQARQQSGAEVEGRAYSSAGTATVHIAFPRAAASAWVWLAR
jgi:hypothetical protein